MLPLYSAVLSSDGLFADLIDLRGLYGAGRLRLTVDRGSVSLSAGAAPDALDVIGDYRVGVSEVSIPLTRWVKVERLTGNSSTILVEILPHTADKRNVIATLSDGRIETPIPKSFDKIRTVFLYGDSGVQYGNVFYAIGSLGLINDGSGKCTFTLAANMYSGMVGWIVNSNDPYWSGPKVITRESNNAWSFPIDPRAAPTLAETVLPSVPAGFICLVLMACPARNSVFHAFNAKAGQPWICVGNAAANGKPAKYMIDHLDRDLGYLPAKPDAIWGQFGANDSRVLGLSVEQAVENAKTLAKMITARGIVLLYQPWQPNDSRDTSQLIAGKNAIRFNRLMRQWMENQPDMYWMPRHEVLVDPTSTSGYAYSNWLGTDGIHDTALTGQACADEAYKAYGPMMVSRKRYLPASIADAVGNDALSRNYFANPLFSTTTGGSVSIGSGNVPAQVAIGKTAGSPTAAGAGGGTDFSSPRTVANDGDTCGNNVAARVTYTAAAEEVYFDVTGLTTGYSVGDKVRIALHVKMRLVSGLRPKLCALYVQHTIGGFASDLGCVCLGNGGQSTSLSLPSDLDEVVMTTEPILITGAVTRIKARIWTAAAGAGVVDFEIGRPLFERIPAGS